ncbi:hypothetical protein GGS20DRAFT_160787 [Poronia punctata]|nr:hypothetical protein GGS20DRAFT_160787 [Poronia punctata]
MRFINTTTAAAVLLISSTLSGTHAAPAPTTTTTMPNNVSSTIGNMDSYSSTCYEPYAYQFGTGIFLIATCHDKNKNWVRTHINLNRCIHNNFGHLEARKDGNFGFSCDRMVQHGYSGLYGYCNNGKYMSYAAIDMGSFLDNQDGHLSCFGYGDELQDPST